MKGFWTASSVFRACQRFQRYPGDLRVRAPVNKLWQKVAPTAEHTDLSAIELSSVALLGSRGEKIDSELNRIGIWGQVWAIAALLPLTTHGAHKLDPLPEAPAELAKRVLDVREITQVAHTLADAKLQNTSVDPKLLLVDPHKTLAMLLGNGSSMQKSPFLCHRLAEQVRDALLDFVLLRLRKLDLIESPYLSASKVVKQVKSDAYASPRDFCFDLIRVIQLQSAVQALETDLENAPTQTGTSFIDKDTWSYATVARHPNFHERIRAHGDLVEDLFASLQTQSKGHDCVAHLVIGQPNDGKKSIVGDLIKAVIRDVRKRQPNSNDVWLRTYWRGEYRDLPVLCLPAQHSDAFTLFGNVITFYERLTKSTSGDVDHVSQVDRLLRKFQLPGRMLSVDDLVDQLSKLVAVAPPAFVILTDVETRVENLRNLILRNHAGRLLECLEASAQDGTRLLITSGAPVPLKRFEIVETNVEPMTGEQIFWYLSDEQMGVFAKVEGAIKEAGLFAASFPGNALMALSVALGTTWQASSQDFVDLMKSVQLGLKSKKKHPLRPVFDELVDQWTKDGLIPWIALILGSEDGMMSATLISCISEWQSRDSALYVAEPKVALDALAKISRFGRGFFLKHTKNPPFFFEEASYQDAKQIDHVWMFERSAAVQLRRSIERGNPERMLAMVNRLVAIHARQRSQNRLLNGVRTYNPHREVPERTVQSLIAQLLSLPELPNEVSMDPPLDPRLYPDRVFTTHEKAYDPVLALRYVVEVMLEQEVDRNHRLSMVADADEMRLAIYALLQAPLGPRRRIWDEMSLNAGVLPDFMGEDLAPHLAHLSTHQRCDLLVKLGLSAAYREHLAIIAWAEFQIQRLRAGSDDIYMLEAEVRLTAARMDLELRVGRPMRVSSSLAGGELTKEAGPSVNKFLRRLRDSKGRLIKPEGALKKLQKVFNHHINTRRAEIEGINDINLRQNTLARLETRLMRVQHFAMPHDNHGGGLIAPMRQLGRTGRLALLSRLAGFPIIHSRIPTGSSLRDMRREANVLLHANISRLSTYAGSERDLVNCDYAVSLFLHEDLSGAIAAAQAAGRRAFHGRAGGGVRFHVICIELGIQLSAKEHGAEVQLGPLWRLLDYLETLATAEGSPVPNATLSIAVVEVLRWRLLMLDGQVKEANTAFERAQDLARRLGADGMQDMLTQRTMA